MIFRLPFPWSRVFLLALIAGVVLAQGRPTRRHTVNESSGKLKLVSSTDQPSERSRVTIEVEGSYRVIRANGIPNHRTGSFPNEGNPHEIRSQRYSYRIPARPKRARSITPLGMHSFGIGINGVPFDPGAAEWYLGERNGKWRYEPLSGAIRLGVDTNHAHVQPSGAYHYHGMPDGLLESVKLNSRKHSPIVGWAADGFPIYALFGYSDPKDANSVIQEIKSSYRVKSGRRPSGSGQPGGRYDGTFLADYEYVKKLGDLDECNGRITVTPEYPDGIYAYFLTDKWPVIPRCYRGTPSSDFTRRGSRGSSSEEDMRGRSDERGPHRQPPPRRGRRR